MKVATTEACRRHCFFRGRVQGVGFRYSTRNLAINYDVTGFVRNLPDGSVELVAEGPEHEVEGFVWAVNERMKPHIREVQQISEPASGHFGQFIIGR
ncbi:MAG TPA: acylphosphatase [Tepidisphaeraceae bacterium]|jgi:acylphosphatase